MYVFIFMIIMSLIHFFFARQLWYLYKFRVYIKEGFDFEVRSQKPSPSDIVFQRVLASILLLLSILVFFVVYVF